MDAAPGRRILVVADLTPGTPHLLELVARRAESEPCRFFVLVPHGGHPHDPDWDVDRATALVQRAADEPVEGLTGGPDALEAVRTVMTEHAIDEIIISTPPRHLAHWIHHDLPSRVERLGVPVTVVEGAEKGPPATPGFGGITLP
jgi:hypothetical protein